MNKKISILGCGWYGLPLARRLVNDGFVVKGSSTRLSRLGELALSGAIPFHLTMNVGHEDNRLDDFFRCDMLVVTIPPPRMSGVDDWHLLIHRMIAEKASRSGVEKVVLISSTSVYADDIEEAKEDDASYVESTHSKVKMLAIEDCYNKEAFKTLVIRPGGLFGPDRHPAKYMSTAEKIANSQSKVNMIHLNDLVDATIHLINNNLNGVFNVCSPDHPTKEIFYNAAFASVGKSAPPCDGILGSKKTVSPQKLIDSGFDFQHDSLIHWFAND